MSPEIIWLLWFLVAVVGIPVASFIVLEYLLWDKGTLSYVTSRLSKPVCALLGLIIGGLIFGLGVHFWWHYCPVGSISIGRLLISPAAAAELRDLTLPDPKLTPGVSTLITVKKLCSKRFRTRDVRNVTKADRAKTFARYDLSGNDDPSCVPDAHGRRCEIDHLISLELGGDNHFLNYWPQPFGTQPWNAVRKDRVENRLHKEVCAGRISLDQAQYEIRTDYRIPYIRYFGEPEEQ